MHLLIQAVLEHFEGKYRHQHRSSHVFAPLFEQAIHEELTGLLTRWLNEAQRGEIGGPILPETMARIVSSAILGTAVQWSQDETTTSSERMAHDIFLVGVEGMARLAPFAKLV